MTSKQPVKQRPFCDMRASMRTNAILQRDKMGKVKQTTYNLPDEDFRYGMARHDGYGVKEIFANYEAIEYPQRTPRKKPSERSASPQNSTKPINQSIATRSISVTRSKVKKPLGRQDYVATNRQAVKAGCINARDFREYRKKHDIFVKPEENWDAAEDAYNKSLHRSMCHGIHTVYDDGMKDCLTYATARKAKEDAIRKREILQTRSIRMQATKTSKHKIRPTRASRGHTHKPDAPPSYAETYKIPRFRDIDHYAIQDKWE